MAAVTEPVHYIIHTHIHTHTSPRMFPPSHVSLLFEPKVDLPSLLTTPLHKAAIKLFWYKTRTYKKNNKKRRIQKISSTKITKGNNVHWRLRSCAFSEIPISNLLLPRLQKQSLHADMSFHWGWSISSAFPLLYRVHCWNCSVCRPLQTTLSSWQGQTDRRQADQGCRKDSVRSWSLLQQIKIT